MAAVPSYNVTLHDSDTVDIQSPCHQPSCILKHNKHTQEDQNAPSKDGWFKISLHTPIFLLSSVVWWLDWILTASLMCLSQLWLVSASFLCLEYYRSWTHWFFSFAAPRRLQLSCFSWKFHYYRLPRFLILPHRTWLFLTSFSEPLLTDFRLTSATPARMLKSAHRYDELNEHINW